MREFSRKDRIADQIKREVADIVQNVLKNPHLGFITITDAECSGDLRYAKVFYSVLGDAKIKSQTAGVLKKSTGKIQSELARRISIRKVPQLSFHVDNSAEYGSKMDLLFKQIEKENNPENEEPEEYEEPEESEESEESEE